MASEHARIRRDIWADDDWRDLTSSEQWLYLHLLTSPALSFCGTTDWRPSRIAAATGELSASDIQVFAQGLTAARFILADDETEEVMIRSWAKHDGLVRSPNMAKALAKSYAAVASKVLRGVIVDQLTILRSKEPDLGGWEHIEEVMKKRSLPFDEGVEILSSNPSGNPSANPFASRASLLTSLPPSLPTSDLPSSSSPFVVTSPAEKRKRGTA